MMKNHNQAKEHNPIVRGFAYMGAGVLALTLTANEIHRQETNTVYLGPTAVCTGEKTIDITYGEPTDAVIKRDAERVGLSPKNAAYLLDIYAQRNTHTIFTNQNGVDVILADKLTSAETCTN